MLELKRKREYEFGLVSADDDRDIQEHRFRQAARRGLWSESLRLFRDIILIISVFVLFGVFVVQPVVVEGTSMVPVLHSGERLLVNKLVYYKFRSFSWGHIERGDIVVFWFPKDPNKSFVKRVIGLPGEMVEIREGRVYINDRQLAEPYIKNDRNLSKLSYPLRRIEDHYYFVMGDNRDNSLDSRTWGLVPEKYVYGKAFFRYWKPTDAGFLKNGKPGLKKEADPRRRRRIPADGDPRAVNRRRSAFPRT